MSSMGSFFSTPEVINKQPYLHVFEAVEGGNVDALKGYRQTIPDFKYLTKHGKTLLHCAIIHKQIDCVKFLIDIGIDVNTRDEFMNTPLLEITQCKSRNTSELHDLIDFLLHSNANINATNSLKRTALLKSIILFRHNISEILLKFGADPNISDTDGLLPIHVCATYSALPLMRQLLQCNANKDAQDVKGRTALYFATLSGHQSIVEELIGHGCNVNRGSSFGFPLQTAIVKCRIDAVNVLLQHGANIHRMVDEQRHLFVKAKDCWSLALTVLNMELSASPNITDATGHILDAGQVERLWKATRIMETVIKAYGKEIIHKVIRDHLRKFEKLLRVKRIPDLTLVRHLKVVHRKLIFICNMSKPYVTNDGGIQDGAIVTSPHSLENICRIKVRLLLGQIGSNVIYSVPRIDCSVVLKDLLLLNDV